MAEQTPDSTSKAVLAFEANTNIFHQIFPSLANQVQSPNPPGKTRQRTKSSPLVELDNQENGVQHRVRFSDDHHYRRPKPYYHQKPPVGVQKYYKKYYNNFNQGPGSKYSQNQQSDWHAKKPFKQFKKKYTQDTMTTIANQNENENPTTKELQQSTEKPIVEETNDKHVKGDGDVPASSESDEKEIPTKETTTEASAASDATSTDASNTVATTSSATPNSREKVGYNLRKKPAQSAMCPIVEETDKEANETKENVENEVAVKDKVEEVVIDLTETERSSQDAKEATKKSDEDNFKIPDIANLTIARLMSTSDAPPSSPIAGGNLKKVSSQVQEKLPNSPPSSASTMSGSELGSRLKDFSENHSLKPSATSIENLQQFEDYISEKDDTLARKAYQKLSTLKNELIPSFGGLDQSFMPITFAHGRHYLFAVSQISQQVLVFKDRKQKGVLKIKDSKFFIRPKAVHFIKDDNDSTEDFLVVLDEAGFHLYTEIGHLTKTILEGHGKNYRGLTHVIIGKGKFIVTLDIKSNRLVFIDCNKDQPTFGNIYKRIDLFPNLESHNDENTKCRFLTVLPDYSEILVTSMLTNSVYSVNVANAKVQKLGPYYEEDKPKSTFEITEAAGIAYDGQTGLVFVGSCEKNSVEILAKNYTYLGTLPISTKSFKPLGLLVHERTLFIANSETKSILQVPLDGKSN